jgi:hypothetical protein
LSPFQPDESLNKPGSQVVVPAWCEYVHHNRVFQRSRLMVDASFHHEAVTNACGKCFATHCDGKLPPHHIDNLVLRVLVHGPHPTLFHAMLRQEQLVVVRAHAPDKTVLRRRSSCVSGAN